MQENDKHYIALLQDIKTQILQSQVKTVMAANAQMLWAYWCVGHAILVQQEKLGWGNQIVHKLSQDLKREFPQIKGFSPRNLAYMRQFALLYSASVIEQILTFQQQIEQSQSPYQLLSKNIQSFDNQQNTILQPPVAKLAESRFLECLIAKISWSHHIVLINKVKDYGQLVWYMINTIENGISRDILDLQIKSNLYERQVSHPKITNFQQTLPQPHSDFANYLLKDPYIFDFVQAKEKADERSKAIPENLKSDLPDIEELEKELKTE